MVTVRELRKALKAFPQDIPVVLSTDAEGNEIRMLNGIGDRYVVALEYRFMESIAKEELDDYDTWVRTAEVW